MAQALDARFLHADGNKLPRAGGGVTLCKLADIDLSGLHLRLKDVKRDAAATGKMSCADQKVLRESLDLKRGQSRGG